MELILTEYVEDAYLNIYNTKQPRIRVSISFPERVILRHLKDKILKDDSDGNVQR